MPSPSAGAFDAQSRRVWTGRDVRRLLRVPGDRDDKRSRGVVALRTGSDAYPGAAVLGVEGAWRAGCGYVRYVGPRRAADLVLARRPETVATTPDADAVLADVWVIGSGTDATTRPDSETSALRALLAGSDPVVVDAGALDLLPATAAPVIATPHAGEFLRLRATVGLAGLSSDTLQDPAARAEAVRETAEALGGAVLLKGATTLVADATAVIAVGTGTPWLATAGTGDVLGGVLGAIVAADRAAGGTTSLAELAATAAWLHGVAGRIASGTEAASGAGEGGPAHPIVALDVADALPAAVALVLGEDQGSEHDEHREHIEHHEETEEGRA
ncbi:ADP-dependent NAD(P)H-hydrate dehydratase [Microbacterium azadirachtae]|uniref:ADP-dependent (S)-NAD(P)H-hydrate dehydratase n=1 Tax=Microbacterium azadirachtae TaxID=582680 RepID=A0A0F0LHF9_9MICO|nr:ADP/ATP-dependent (S)-NAD(P)H-hydrate dehydratase [Microbacterium azadirachtae]KJL30981.1 Bifunctional NAD(P)H-hydrate repair enzyme Nnr [Microbacterium azadirachtae]